jgi:hypothetical protein
MYGCQIGTKFPIFHAVQDQLYPIGSSNGCSKADTSSLHMHRPTAFFNAGRRTCSLGPTVSLFTDCLARCREKDQRLESLQRAAAAMERSIDDAEARATQAADRFRHTRPPQPIQCTTVCITHAARLLPSQPIHLPACPLLCLLLGSGLNNWPDGNVLRLRLRLLAPALIAGMRIVLMAAK